MNTVDPCCFYVFVAASFVKHFTNWKLNNLMVVIIKFILKKITGMSKNEIILFVILVVFKYFK